MTNRWVWIFILMTLLVALILFWHHAADKSGESIEEARMRISESSLNAPDLPASDDQLELGRQTNEVAQDSAEAGRAIQAIFGARLALFGLVVDQNGNPVAGAQVRIRVADKPWDPGSSRELRTGPEGLFEISNVLGAGLYVEVEKEGYYAGKESRRILQSGEMPTRAAPAVWKLHSKGIHEPLIHHDPVWTEISMDGTPVEYDFNTRKFVGSGHGQVRAEVRVEGSMRERFTWWYRLSVPSGGFAPRAHEYDFIAPEYGYTEIVEQRVSADDSDWRGAFNGDYFIRLPDGTFGQLKLALSRGRNSFSFRIDHAAINPSGGRNLEYDPKSVPPFVRATQLP